MILARLIAIIAAVFFFVLAALAVWTSLDWQWQGLVSVGLALFAASFVTPPRV